MPTLSPEEPAFVGRSSELAALEAAVRRAGSGNGQLVYVESPTGGGKSRLLRELRRRALAYGAWVLSGQGTDQRFPLPFQALGGIVAEVLAAGAADPAFADRLRQCLGPQREAVCEAVPELVAILGPTGEAGGTEAQALLRGARAVAALLDAIGAVEPPAVVVLDDCEWMDAPSAAALRAWSERRTARGQRYASVIVAFRSDGLPRDHVLLSLAPEIRLSLEPLDPADVEKLVATMAKPLPREAIQAAARSSRGNPLMAWLAASDLVESGAPVTAPPATAGLDTAVPRATVEGATELISRRLRALPPEVLRTLSAGAVIGRDFDGELVSRLAGLRQHDAEELLDIAERRQLITPSARGRFAFAHDAIRDAVLDILTHDRLSFLHRRAAQLIEERDPSRVFELAHHLDAAGEREAAATHALTAAERSRAQYALETAERLYRIAEHGAARAAGETRLRIFLGLGDVLTLRGRYDEASLWYDRARPLAVDRLARARIASKRAEVAFKASQYDRAIAASRDGLAMLGRGTPTSPIAFLLLFMWEALVHVIHALAPRWTVGRRALGTSAAEADLLAVSLYDRLIYLWYFAHAGKVRSGWACLRALNLAETYPPTFALGHAYSVLSNIIAGGFPPLVGWSLRLRTKAIATQEKIGTLHARGQALVYSWPVSHSAMRFDEGIERARAGRALLELAGDQWDLNASYWGAALCQLCKGEVVEAIRECRDLYGRAKSIGDHQNTANALWVWSQAAPGRVPEGLIEDALTHPGLFVSSRISLLGAQGIRRLGSGDPTGALAPLDEACRLALERGLIDTLIGDVLSWHSAALRWSVPRDAALEARRRSQLLRLAATRSRQARWFGRIYPLLRPAALRESGLVAAARGDARRARAYLDEAVRVAERQGMRLQRALALRARGTTGRALGWKDAADDIAVNEREFDAMGATAAGWFAPPKQD